MTKNQNEQERESDAAFVEAFAKRLPAIAIEPLWHFDVEMWRLIALARRAAAIPDAGAEAIIELLAVMSRRDGWQLIETAPKQGVLLGYVDGAVRMIAWSKTSHVPLYGWCVVDQGPEDRDLCDPEFWRPLPPAPVTK